MTGNRDSSVQFTTHHKGDPNSWSYGEIIDIDVSTGTFYCPSCEEKIKYHYEQTTLGHLCKRLGTKK